MTPHEDLEALSAYLDDALDAEEVARVEEHLASCEECTNLSGRLKAASSAVASLGETRLSTDDSRELRQAVLLVAKKPSPWFTPARLAGALGAAALIGAGIIGLNVITRSSETPTTADQAGSRSAFDEAAPAAVSEQSFNSPEELLAAAKEDPDVLRGVNRFVVSDVGNVQDEELRRWTEAGEQMQSDIVSSETAYGPTPWVTPTPLWGCLKKVLQEKPYPTVSISAKPAVYKGEKAWMLLYAFTYSHEENAALDYVRLQMVRRHDCGLLVEQVFKPS